MPKATFRAFRTFLEESSFLRHYLWKYRKWVGIGLLALLTVDILEVVPPYLLKRAIDVSLEKQPREYLLYFALAYFGVSIIQGICRYAWRMYLIRASMLSGRDLRGRFSSHLFHLSASFFDKRKIGDLMSLNTNDIDAMRMAIGPGALVFADAMFYFLTVPAAMLLLSPQLTLIAFIPLPLIPWFVIRNEKAVHSRFLEVQDSFAKLSALAQENLNGMRVVKGFARENHQNARFRDAGLEYIRLNLKLARVQSAFGPMLDFIMSLGMVLLLWVGGRHVITDAVTLGTFVAFQRYIQKMIWPMTAVGMAITYYQRAVASSDRLKEVLRTPSDVTEPEAPKVPARVDAGASWRTAGRIEIRDLHFRYPGSAVCALEGITLTIEPGERVAFVGAIGSGKTALLGLLPRLYPVGREMISVDGVDINDWSPEELRRQIGYVSQDVFLFSETVAENVAYGLHDWMRSRGGLAELGPEQSRAEIERAARIAYVHEDLMRLPSGYQTRLGERGVNLSGGQKQRLTIARALAKQPAILILDDALSSVDVRTEEKILSQLRSRPGKNTELIAAHRISTIKESDRIVVLDRGRIAQQGTHDSLLAEPAGIYAKFYEQQRLREDLEEYVGRIDPAQPEVVR